MAQQHDNKGKTPAPPAPAPQQSRERRSIDPRDTGPRAGDEDGRDAERLTPEGQDPRRPTDAGPMSTSENVTTDEQRAAQEAYKSERVGDSPVPREVQGRQIEAQRAAAENPLSPRSTPMPDLGGDLGGQGLVHPPAPEGTGNPVPQPAAAPGQFPSKEQLDQRNQEYREARQGRQRRRLEESKTKRKVRQAFTLTDDLGRTHRYEPGEVEMPDSHADHWYAQQFLVPEDED